MSIESELAKYFKTSAGKKKIADARSAAAAAGKAFGSGGAGGGASRQNAIRAATEMRKILVDWLASVHLNSIGVDDIVISEPVMRSDGQYEINLSFTDEAIRRESLHPKKFPDGAYNIVKLFTVGWDAEDKQIFGKWHGHFTRSRTQYDGSDFMQKAVDDFNQLGIGTAILNDEYVR